MNIGLNPAQLSSGAPGLEGLPGSITTPKLPTDKKVDGFGDLLLRKNERIGKPSNMGSVIGDVIKQVDAKQKAADATRTAFLAGESGNLHQTIIASQEASLSFSLMVEMRNKVMEAYQELMRIQI